jgi:hypothetical protein
LLNQLQQQMELVTRTLGAIAERLDNIEERSNIDENRRGRVDQGGDVAIDDVVGEH